MIPPGRHPRQRQQGAIAIFAALGISVMISVLAILDIGFLYHYKRDLQKAADLAALAGAEEVRANCSDAKERASNSVYHNLATIDPENVNRECGVWDRGSQEAPPSFTVDTGEARNALRVTVSGSPPKFLIPGDRPISAVAIATDGDPVTTFSVGTRLAQVGGDSVVGGLLRTVGIDPSIDLMDYDDGLAGVTVTPRGLLEALGIPVSADLSVADFNALLAAESLSLGEVLDAVVTVAGQEELIGLNTQLLNALSVPLNVSPPNIEIPLGTEGPGGGGLFAAITSSPGTALDVGVSALDLVTAAIGIATSGRAIDVDIGELPGLGILGIDNLTVKTGLIEPPSIGIGGTVCESWNQEVCTKAYSAQTRVFAHVQLDSGDIVGLGGLLTALGTNISVDLPIVIDAASATGELKDLCTPELKALDLPKCPGGEDCADIQVDMEVAKICLGDVDPDSIFSTSESCDVGLDSKQLLNVDLLGANLASLNSQLGVDILNTDDELVTLAVDQEDMVGGEFNIGETVGDLTDALLAALLASGLNEAPPLSESERQELATEIWEEVGGDSCSSASCRGARFDEAVALIDDSVRGLSGFLGNAVLNPVVGLLDSVLTLDLVGALGSVGDLVGGVLGLLDDILGGLLGLDSCSGWLAGSEDGCIQRIAEDILAQPAGSGSSTESSNVVLLGLLMEVLRPILDDVGSALLKPLLEDLLGLRLGQTDVAVAGLECRKGAVLVH